VRSNRAGGIFSDLYWETGIVAAISSSEFVKEIQQMVRAKHSKIHPIIGMIEDGKGIISAEHSY